ncbi:MAG: tRNA glutamyl-Q(34) synthetase GluQRS [Candidatus Endonucleobacter bathymodioli]|uniref:Glutamyl-Q tRNA(Asp) synthetase n=1 Tax=Candidatus Endonucleibacter bathymodioli TaxID=539814 RepID=A0AA90NMK2_9GAMM|nr:tRNA glutamyl-Q(34) synthetase GluQRS [Candidatus Endonucleobacter bathymodioli]
MASKLYKGRFAPSPSGLLHFGSLTAALASYLDARANGGTWLVRIEDIDPHREQPRTADLILYVLEAYGLEWDDNVIYQSRRHEAYQTALVHLIKHRSLYPCTCSRKKLSGLNGTYPGYCRNKPPPAGSLFSLRLKCPDIKIEFHDLIQGKKKFELTQLGDFILLRKDLLYAYQLAVCVDDQFQKITHVVRGYDLIDSTPRQIYLQSVLNYRRLNYAHIPVVTEVDGGEKLSKQNKAQPIPLDEPRPLLVKAMKVLGLNPDRQLRDASVTNIIQWGVDRWNIHRVPATNAIPLSIISDTQ